MESKKHDLIDCIDSAIDAAKYAGFVSPVDKMMVESKLREAKQAAIEKDKLDINYPQIFFAVKWMCENIDTDQIDLDDLASIKKLADECHVAYLKET